MTSELLRRRVPIILAAVCGLIGNDPYVNASIIRTNGLATIFGYGGENDNDPSSRDYGNHGSSEQQEQQQEEPQLPPPPPRFGNHELQMTESDPSLPPPPPRGTGVHGGGEDPSNGVATPPPPFVIPPPPPGAEAWQQQPDPAFEGMKSSPSSPWLMMDGYGVPGSFDRAAEEDRFRLIQCDLEASMQREHELAARLQNATAILVGMEQREGLHVRQLDVLTERVMDVEAQASLERNQLLEYQANCTALDLEIAQLKGEIDEWKDRCLKSEEQKTKQRKEYSRLEKKLAKAKQEAEKLATLIERNRLEELRGSYQRRKNSNPTGLFGLFFGRPTRDDDELEKLRETAKGTLLNALRTERNNVEELEAAVSILEQNNTIIALQVQSRDEIIDELNERVAVFEEDKLVLKAALKQLQKEMAEEAPKTQKLIDDLEGANAEIERLQEEMAEFTETQQQKVESLELIISKKQDEIQETKANLTLIGEYVDKLEERLADFSVARREIEKREQTCKDIEMKSEEIEIECTSLREQIKKYETEHEELKELLEELVGERTNLQSQIARSLSDKENASKEIQRLQDSIEALQQETTNLQQQQQQQLQQQEASGKDWDVRIQDYESRLASLSDENQRLEESTGNYENDLADLRQELDELVQIRQELESQLAEAHVLKTNLESRLNEVTDAQVSAEARVHQDTEMYQDQLAEAQTRTAALLQEQQASFEAQILEERQQYERELVDQREQINALLLKEAEGSKPTESGTFGEEEEVLLQQGEPSMDVEPLEKEERSRRMYEEDRLEVDKQGGEYAGPLKLDAEEDREVESPVWEREPSDGQRINDVDSLAETLVNEETSGSMGLDGDQPLQMDGVGDNVPLPHRLGGDSIIGTAGTGGKSAEPTELYTEQAVDHRVESSTPDPALLMDGSVEMGNHNQSSWSDLSDLEGSNMDSARGKSGPLNSHPSSCIRSRPLNKEMHSTCRFHCSVF